MYLHFSTLGLSLEAEIKVYRGRPGTYWEPPEDTELEILSLQCEGKDASFLMDSSFAQQIEEAAYEALYVADRSAKEDAAIAAAECRMEERMCHY